MKFSAQEEYGLRCLLQIARADKGALTIPEISLAEGLTQAHVAKLLMILRRAGFITSTRGQTGGYALAGLPSTMPISDILNALGGKLYDEEFCMKHSDNRQLCTRAIDCSVRSLWQFIQGSVDSALREVTLADLLVESSSNVTMYAIPERLVQNL